MLQASDMIPCKCGGKGWLEAHTPCHDHPELVRYYGCCTGCDIETDAEMAEERAVRAWNELQAYIKSQGV